MDKPTASPADTASTGNFANFPEFVDNVPGGAAGCSDVYLIRGLELLAADLSSGRGAKRLASAANMLWEAARRLERRAAGRDDESNMDSWPNDGQVAL